jgi:hypothetical protein
VNSDVSASAAIAYAKLNLTNSIVNSDVNSSAAIAYSKLNLANSIVSGDIVNGTITSSDLSSTGGSEAVATANIQADAVTAAKVATGAVPNPLYIFTPIAGTTGQPWTNQPQVRTEFFGASTARMQVDLSVANQYRFESEVLTASTSPNTPKLCVQFSTDNGTTWTYLDGTADAAANTTASASCVSIASTGMQKTAFLNLTAAAKADVQLRVVGLGGDANKDPAFQITALEVR